MTASNAPAIGLSRSAHAVMCWTNAIVPCQFLHRGICKSERRAQGSRDGAAPGPTLGKGVDDKKFKALQQFSSSLVPRFPIESGTATDADRPNVKPTMESLQRLSAQRLVLASRTVGIQTNRTLSTA